MQSARVEFNLTIIAFSSEDSNITFLKDGRKKLLNTVHNICMRIVTLLAGRHVAISTSAELWKVGNFQFEIATSGNIMKIAFDMKRDEIAFAIYGNFGLNWRRKKVPFHVWLLPCRLQFSTIRNSFQFFSSHPQIEPDWHLPLGCIETGKCVERKSLKIPFRWKFNFVFQLEWWSEEFKRALAAHLRCWALNL